MPDTRSTPSNIYPCIFYDDAPAAIDWLCRAFGFTRRMVVPGDTPETIVHSELSLDTGVIMVATAKPERGWVSARSLPAMNQTLCVHVDDPDAHCARAAAEGDVVLQPLRDEDYGSRGYLVRDPEGHQWYFGTNRPGSWWD